MAIIKQQLFGQLDFRTLTQNPDFKEDSVREVIILPILKELGYVQENIVRSKTLQHPFLKIGSKKRPITLVPDYILKVENNFAWVLDAKAPDQKIINNDNVAQVYSYATHPEIRSNYFALCNGLEFSVFRTNDTEQPVLFFQIDEIEHHWKDLKLFLSPNSFQIGKNFTYDTTNATAKPVGFDYATRPLLEEIEVKKRAVKRHFGVHGYFTKQTWNVVAEYIKNFSKPGDLVLDPFGGSGVTAIEALMNSRKGINIDINPMAVFLVSSLIAPVKQSELTEAFNQIKEEYIQHEPKTEAEIKKAIKKYPQPKPLPLPKGSDVETADQLFSDKQLAQLGFLKSLILKQENENIRNSLLLMFSGLVTKVNLTYHTSKIATKDGQGDASAFRYYRYRIAPEPKDVEVIKYFELRFQKISDAKKEMAYFINEKTISNAQIVKGSATNLKFIPKESVDYIYTDPPYGKKIPYLDLSVMWNAWLDLEVTEEDYKQEAIEGGEQKKSKDEYNELIAQSIKEMYRVLKYDRWLSFVFAHKDPEFWHLIIDTAERCGFEYIGAVPQKNGQTSFKKRQNPFTVLSGQLIINFRKVRNPKAILKANLGMDIAEIVMQTIEGIIAKNNGATLEQINDELIIKGLELGFLDLLKKEYTDLTPILLDNFDYNEKTEEFTLKKNTKFRTHVDVRLRIKYYLISFLRRMERENKQPHFDQIILEILPLLKNGTTPENQTVLNVLKDIAERVGEDSWRLKREGQTTLFD
ncbi:MAG: type I restriction enzyme HsdR N-terminal domain-containing protein [Sphingobacteriales bacterium]|jgi:16S rRNA G966 N2-methylase RsmD|nr:type I restriction enzyme HsdR N-terminal domain-containing protein [Sphingobacteriales bacterium]MBK6891137.1 type I restriction enzyme HsdR N-terminal domain-containing protein [Sphingobacteriales bacterium]MBK7527036.1 type I restriction enzyme HsdR N-terminal domain-containing protein [Sphingobacteriales bacterium]MBP9141483.1 type I restriction enzyme HsdR N-terminal domain-containing protein [Chitinophagales bacterium]